MRACALVRLGRQSLTLAGVRTWVVQGEQRGSTPRVYAFAFVQTSATWPTTATRNRWRVHGDDTETRARRTDLGEAVFRVEVAKRVRTWGRWLDGHTCAGALGFAATARRNVEHGHRQVKQGLSPSVACVRVCAERRWHGHGGDTKLMACTRQGNKERGTARDGTATLVRHIHRRTTSCARECACTDSTRKNRASARWWCVRAKRRRHSCRCGIWSRH
jgi:hypothetical protein